MTGVLPDFDGNIISGSSIFPDGQPVGIDLTGSATRDIDGVTGVHTGPVDVGRVFPCGGPTATIIGTSRSGVQEPVGTRER